MVSASLLVKTPPLLPLPTIIPLTSQTIYEKQRTLCFSTGLGLDWENSEWILRFTLLVFNGVSSSALDSSRVPRSRHLFVCWRGAVLRQVPLAGSLGSLGGSQFCLTVLYFLGSKDSSCPITLYKIKLGNNKPEMLTISDGLQKIIRTSRSPCCLSTL